MSQREGCGEGSDGLGRGQEAPIEPRDLALATIEAALAQKAEDVICLDLTGLLSYCDYFVICNGTSRRHAAAVAEGVIEALRERGLRPIGVEGLTAQRWVLADFGDVLLHVFDPDMRGFYDLEGMWSDAPRMLPSGEVFDPRPRARAAVVAAG